MRDISIDPITTADVKAVVAAAFEAASENDQLAFAYLRTFLEMPHVNKQLLAHLDELQPKHKEPGLAKLSLTDLQGLLGSAYQGTEKRVWEAKYRGISKRSSYVYDLTMYPEALHRDDKLRLYVRMDPDGIPRGEINEDNFTLPKQTPPPAPPDPSLDSPVSGTWYWLQILKDWFKQIW